jgi:glycosyltransferase involved in cell wall biosynthesis
VPGTPPRIIWAGRLHEVKGPQRMIRLMGKLVAQRPATKLLMAGDGPEREACAHLIEQLGLSASTRMLGQRDDLARIFAHAEILCITSLNEGFSLVAAEAAAAGLPVVAYHVGGVGEVVRDGVTGLLVPDGDERAFLAALTRLLDDAPLRLQMGQQAAIHARRFGMREHVDLLVSEYRRAVAQRQGAAA